MRLLLLPALLCAPVAAAAGPAVSILPFEGNIFFGPESPKPLAPDHPLYRRVVFDVVDNMPSRVGFPLAPITKASEFNRVVRRTLDSANMLAPSDEAAKVRLRVRWGSLHTPTKIGITSTATMTASYELRRIDNGQVLFARDIVTHGKARGGDGFQRAVGTARGALVANLASAILCLDKAAFGRAPADCALSPGGSFRAPITVVTPIYRR